jgi:outer membrane immunogenic protein
MKRILTSIFFAAALSAPALAADMAPAYKAPIYAPVDPWTGFYVGGSIGARWSDVSWKTLDFDSANPPTNVDNPAHLNDTSFRVGAYAGYNWRFASSALVGLEADIAWANNSKTHGGFPGADNAFGTGTFTDPTVDSITAKLGWDGSIRGRIGYLVNPNWLAYATGGIAWQEIKTDSICTMSTSTSFCDGTFSGSSSTTKTGWTAGGGVETLLLGNWIGRVEYRYADFGHVTNTLPPAPRTGFQANVDVKTHTALVGVAYKF